MSWLARIRLTFAEAARLRFHDNYSWHRAAWDAFPEREGEARLFLSRLNVRSNGFDLLLLSKESPRRPSWCLEDAYEVKTVRPDFLDHSNYLFDLRANPTRKLTKLDRDGKPTKNGKRVALLQLEDQVSWIERKAENGGFRLLENPPMVVDPAVSHMFHMPKRNRRGLHWGVDFRGGLQVTDRERFVEAFYGGIGSAKAFGFGMLLLKPCRFSPIL